jgi:hypothetical protein
MPVMVKMPLDFEQFYKAGEIPFESTAKFPLLCEDDLGYPIDLVSYIQKSCLIIFCCVFNNFFLVVYNEPLEDKIENDQLDPEDDILLPMIRRDFPQMNIPLDYMSEYTSSLSSSSSSSLSSSSSSLPSSKKSVGTVKIKVFLILFINFE